jgi:outer membrane receptor for ferrienterochelin and colicins
MIMLACCSIPYRSRAEPVSQCAEERAAQAAKRCEPVEVVVVGTRTAENTQRASLRTGIVTREEAERRGARNVGEALAAETSLQVNAEAYSYLGRPSGVQMQGLDAERVLILEDGERVTGDVGGVVDLSLLPLTDVERIEYVTGPSSSLYGSNALGGVVNVVTGAPRELGPSARFRLEARSRGELLAEASGAYRGAEHWAVFDTSFGSDPGQPIEDGRPDTLVPRRRSRLLSLRAGAPIGSRIELRLRARWLHDELTGLVSEEVPGLGVYLVDLPETTDRLVLRVRELVHLGSGARLELSLQKSSFRGSTARDRRGSALDERRARKLDSHSLEGVFTIADGEARTWVLGVRSESERFSQELLRNELDAGSLGVRRLAEVPPVQLANAALFTQLAWRLAPVFRVLPGARAELHDRYGVIVAPRLAVAVEPFQSAQLRAALGRGFRAPSAKEYGFVFDHSAIGYRVLGNPALEPERSWGLNGDVSVRAVDGLALRAGAFANWVSELITMQISPRQVTPAITDYNYVNVAHARTMGADASLQVKAEDTASVELGYAYLWTRDDSKEAALPNRPAHTLTLAARGRWFERLEGSASYRWVSSAYVAPGLWAPSFGALDLRLGLRLWRDVEAYLGALNVLDERKDPARLGDARPPLGRSFILGVRAELPGNEEAEHAP